ncbi:hypothetical protein ACIBI7_44010 [Nonomuraea fuscirosea]|uniref:hypothetical protein n=1 Tax=Nonomuraea fuscirosea TaxID=1291556 RepID=UPI00379DFC53
MRVPLAVLAAVILSCAASPAAHGTASAKVQEVVEYECTTKATQEKQSVSIDVGLTVPAQATVKTQMTIGWTGAYTAGSQLLAPETGLEGEVNMYVYAGISGIDGLTSATGVAPLDAVVPGEPIVLPSTAEVRTTPGKPGSGTVHAAAINFGPRPQGPVIECEVKDKDSLREYPLTVAGAGQSPSESPSPDATDTEASEPTETETPAETPEETPTGGVATGAGGEAEPDGRMVVAAGLVITMAALAGLRRRRPKRAL